MIALTFNICDDVTRYVVLFSYQIEHVRCIDIALLLQL